MESTPKNCRVRTLKIERDESDEKLPKIIKVDAIPSFLQPFLLFGSFDARGGFFRIDSSKHSCYVAGSPPANKLGTFRI